MTAVTVQPMMKAIGLCLAFIITLLLPIEGATSEKILRVGLAPGEPFVITKNGVYEGIAVDIWKEIADDLNIKYEFVLMSEHIDDDIKSLINGGVDIIVGPLVPTIKRTELVDFTRPFFINKTGIVTNITRIDFFKVFQDVIARSFTWLWIVIFLIFAIYIHVFWFFGRKTGYMGVEPNYLQGIRTAFWINTLDIGFTALPPHPITRLFRLFSFLAATLFFSTIIATVTSSLSVAVSNDRRTYNAISELSNKEVVAVSGTAQYAIAMAAGLNVVPVDSREEAFKRVLERKAFGYAEYYTIAQSYIHDNHLNNELMMTGIYISQNMFAFALRINSPLRHSINVALAKLQGSGRVRMICQNILMYESIQNCEL